jgi:L-2-hydroxyglutarate oxidase LhgO
MTMDRIDVLVVGAGVVGLACARVLAQTGREVVIAEGERQFGTGVSARNSEVIHSGIYYPSGSLKAQLCVRGARLLYEFCEQRGVAHRRCGKLVVATREADVPALERLHQRGVANGVDGLGLLSAAQAMAIEPALSCAAALASTNSGIVDSHGLMMALLGDAEAAGAVLAVASRVREAEPCAHGWRVRVQGGASDAGKDTDFELEARWIVNAAGLDAQAVASAMHGFPSDAIPKRHLAKGHYFSLAGRSPFSRLVYPMPVDGGLGVHLTIDLGGQARFGPDVEWLPDQPTPGHALDYAVDARRCEAFFSEVRRYWPGLPDGALLPAYTGIRPKLGGPGESPVDFRIEGPTAHGCTGVVQLFGIESPGLTSSLAIAEQVAAIVDGD